MATKHSCCGVLPAMYYFSEPWEEKFTDDRGSQD